MTHDPLCKGGDCTCTCDQLQEGHRRGGPGEDCDCLFIAEIRADERAKCIDVLDAHHPRCTEPCDLCAEWSALREGLEALAGNP